MKKFVKLKPEQQKAVKMLIAADLDINDGETGGKRRMTLDQIAKACDVSVKTLFLQRTQDKDFQEAREEFAEAIADEMLPEVYGAIRKQVQKGNIKAAELYLKTRGKLIDRKEVQADVNQTITEVSNKSNDDLRKELEELKGRLLDDAIL